MMEGKDNNCPICLESFKDKRTAYVDVCDHVFCFECLNKWLKIESYCPIDRKKIREIISSGEIIKVKSRKRKRSKTLYDVSVFCEICNDSKQNDTVILCDSCDLAFHMVCLDPPLKYVPTGHWYCSVCKNVARRLKEKANEGKSKHTLVESKASTSSGSLVRTQKKVKKKKSKVADTNKHTSAKDFRDSKKILSLHHIENSSNRKKNNSFVLRTKHVSDCNTEISSDSEDFFSIHGDDIILTTKQKFWNKQNNFSSDKEVDKRISNPINKNPALENLEVFFSIQDNNVNVTNEISNTIMQNSSIIESTLKGRILRSCRKINKRRSQRLAAGKKSTEDTSRENDPIYLFTDIENVILHYSPHQNSSLINLQKDKVHHGKEHPSFESLHEISEANHSDTEDSDQSESFSEFEKLNTLTLNEKCSNLNETVTNFNQEKIFGIPNKNLDRLEYVEVCKLNKSSYSVNNTSNVTVNQVMDFDENSIDVLQSPMEVESSNEKYSTNLERRDSSMCDSNEINDEMNTISNERNCASLQFSVFEKLDDTLVASKKYLNLNKAIRNHKLKSFRKNLGGLSCTETCKTTLKNSISSVKQTSPPERLVDLTEDCEENPLDNINIREVQYAMKAKRNLPAELKKIEQEKWKFHHVKSKKKSKCNSLPSRNGANVSFHSAPSTSNNMIFTEKEKQVKVYNDDEDIFNIYSSNIIKSYLENEYIMKNLVNNDNYSEIADNYIPEETFTVTEYNLMHFKEKVSYNNNPKDILCGIFPSNSLKHLDVRPDGSLFINWTKSRS